MARTRGWDPLDYQNVKERAGSSLAGGMPLHRTEIPRDHDPRPKHARNVSIGPSPSQPYTGSKGKEGGKEMGRAVTGDW